MLDGLDAVDWLSFEQPSWNREESVPQALRTVAEASSEDEGSGAYHRLLYALGNNHAGTYYPVVLPALPFMIRLLSEGSTWARITILDALVDLAGSFEPETNCQGSATLRSRVLTEMRQHLTLVRGFTQSRDPKERDLAGQVVELLTDASA